MREEIPRRWWTWLGWWLTKERRTRWRKRSEPETGSAAQGAGLDLAPGPLRDRGPGLCGGLDLRHRAGAEALLLSPASAGLRPQHREERRRVMAGLVMLNALASSIGFMVYAEYGNPF